MKHNTTAEITLAGTIVGRIWMPAVTCGKPFKLTHKPGPWGDFHYADGSRPTLRDMVLKATNDGDFQDASIIDATLTVKRIRHTVGGSVTHTRHVDIRQFPSVQDCVVEMESDEYWAGVDCFQDEEE